LNQYEIAILFDPDLEVDLEKATKRVKKYSLMAAVNKTNTDNWASVN